MPGESKTSKRRLKARERWLAALELRKQGLTFEAIAGALGYAGESAAYKAVMSALGEVSREPVEEMRKLEATRLDKMQEKLSDKIGPDKDDGLPVVDRVLRIMDRRAKLLGLDQPQKSEVDVKVKGPLVIVRGLATKEEAEKKQSEGGGK